MPADFLPPEHKQPDSSIEATNQAISIRQSSEVDSPQFRVYTPFSNLDYDLFKAKYYEDVIIRFDPLTNKSRLQDLDQTTTATSATLTAAQFKIKLANFKAFENAYREDLSAIDETNMILNMIVLRLELPDRQAAIDLVQKIHAQIDSRRKTPPNNIMCKNTILMTEETIRFFTGGRLSLASFCTNRLKLLNLPAEIIEALQSKKLDYTKASPISRIVDDAKRAALLDRAVKEGLSFRQIKEEVAKIQPPKSRKK